MEYLIVFFISSLCGYCSEKVKKLRYFFAFIAILLPSILGGVRSPKLGTDNFYFFQPDFYIAHASESFVKAEQNLNFDILSEWLFYFISRFTSNYHWFCFIVSLITMSLVYIAIFRKRGKCDVGLALLIYFFLFYCPMICYARQSIALALCLFSVHYAENKKYSFFFIIIAIAYFFHASAILFLIYFIINYFLNKNVENRKKKGLLMLLIVGVSTFAIIYIFRNILPDMVLSIDRLQTLSNRYSVLTTESSYSSILKLMLSIIPPIFIGYLYRKQLLETPLYIYWIIIINTLFILQIGSVSIKMSRASFYFQFFLIFFLSGIHLQVKRNKTLLRFMVFGYIIVYWYLFSVRNGYGFTLPVYPYMTDIIHL